MWRNLSDAAFLILYGKREAMESGLRDAGLCEMVGVCGGKSLLQKIYWRTVESVWYKRKKNRKNQGKYYEKECAGHDAFFELYLCIGFWTVFDEGRIRKSSNNIFALYSCIYIQFNYKKAFDDIKLERF